MCMSNGTHSSRAPSVACRACLNCSTFRIDGLAGFCIDGLAGRQHARGVVVVALRIPERNHLWCAEFVLSLSRGFFFDFVLGYRGRAERDLRK